MSIASKLKDLVIKWGGQPTKDDDSIEELIALLTELDAPSSGSGALVVHEITVDESTMRLDKTMGEIINAMPLVFVYLSQTEAGITTTFYDPLNEYELGADGGYLIHYGSNTYNAASLDDYPTASRSQ